MLTHKLTRFDGDTSFMVIFITLVNAVVIIYDDSIIESEDSPWRPRKHKIGRPRSRDC